jgi:peptidoglycan hydrolase-like protein with peptidoglycan-binding domain
MPRTLRKGDKGEDVRNLQRALNMHLTQAYGYKRLATDADFGPLTDGRVREFQRVNLLDADGIVGILTREKLLDVRSVRHYARAKPRRHVITGRPSHGLAPLGLPGRPQMIRGLQATGQRLGPQIGQVTQQPGPPMKRQFQLLGGQQLSINPWFLSPLVITGQVNWTVTNNGRPDFMLSAGAQVAVNDFTGPSGAWTVQGFAQMGFSGLLKKGDFDLLNPFAVIMLQRSEKPKPFQVGFGVGNQMNYNLTKGGLQLFLNGQAVTGVNLDNGDTSAPGVQIMGGASYTFDWP